MYKKYPEIKLNIKIMIIKILIGNYDITFIFLSNNIAYKIDFMLTIEQIIIP